MADHNETGKIGEELAVSYLSDKGFIILHRNWVFGKLEVDIIASFKGKLHFIEVKTRHNLTFGYPEEGVSKRKVTNIMKAADQYLNQHQEWEWAYIDILAIQITSAEIKYFFIEDVSIFLT